MIGSFVYFGSGTTTGQAAGIALKNGQHLLVSFAGLCDSRGTQRQSSPTVLVPQPTATACSSGPCRPMLDDAVAGDPQGVDANDGDSCRDING
jgi:hypothetical protein